MLWCCQCGLVRFTAEWSRVGGLELGGHAWSSGLAWHVPAQDDMTCCGELIKDAAYEVARLRSWRGDGGDGIN